MYEQQKWYQSRTVWGGIVAILAGAAAAFGYVVDESAQAEIVTIVTAIAGSLGGALAVYGRVKATKEIK